MLLHVVLNKLYSPLLHCSLLQETLSVAEVN